MVLVKEVLHLPVDELTAVFDYLLGVVDAPDYFLKYLVEHSHELSPKQLQNFEYFLEGDRPDARLIVHQALQYVSDYHALKLVLDLLIELDCCQDGYHCLETHYFFVKV